MNGLYDEIRIAIHGIWRRRWLALGIAWGLCLAGWLVVAMMPNRYESSARVFAETRSMLPDSVGANAAEQQKDIDRVRQTLASSVNLEKVVRGTDLNLTVASDRDVANRIEGLRQSIKIVAQQDNLFQITASSESASLSDNDNAKLSRAIVQKLIDIFVDENLSGGRAESTQTLKFLDAQLTERSRQLQLAEAKRVEFETKYMGMLPGTGSVADRMDAARSELSRLDSDLGAAQSALSAVNGQMAATTPTVATPSYGGGGGGGTSRYATIQAQIADGRSRGWTDEHPDMIALRSQLGSARASEPARGGGGGGSSANPLFISLRSMQAERQAAVAALASRKAQIETDMRQFVEKTAADPAVAAEAGRLARDYGVLKDQYSKLLADREEVKLRGQMDSETDAVKFRVIDPPSAPRLPVAPNRPLLLTLVLVAGLAGGIGAAFALGQIQTTYPTADRLAKASGLPVIGSIGAVTTSAERAEAKKHLQWFAGGGAALAGAYALLLAVEFVQRGMVA